jgi:hypothetical protein
MYAFVRIAPFFFYSNVPVLAICVASHVVEAITISWEQLTYDAPPGTMVAQTMMGIFSSGVTAVTYLNPGNLITVFEPGCLPFMGACVCLNWILWLATVVNLASKPKAA